MLPLGSAAPAFTADSTQGTIKLEEHLGKRPIVLVFYPKNETPICTQQLCAVRDSKEQYAAYDALVLGINPASTEAHSRFASRFMYDFPLISDKDDTIRQLYGVGQLLFGLLGQQRFVYVIGRSGRIIFAQKGNPPTERMLAALKSDQGA
ncbi:peroxiredoxin [Paenibacillus sp. YYML68]|uniref:peroxiredoxin n=1 Tax=Paenibacillus sp. YYML68 TaxID=2909250 RepID=UPI002492585D|nr:peroxiredoxin [Paenibacillus sp. YYML68]